jgi:DNA-binding NarL/FixJ family response regulator
VASRALEPELINETYRLGAAFIVKPFAESYIDDFARSATRAQATLKALIDAWQLRYRLCNAEGDLLHAAANGEGREGAARRRACSPCTIKTHIANLLRKTGDASMNGAVIRLLREAAGLNGCDLVPES